MHDQNPVPKTLAVSLYRPASLRLPPISYLLERKHCDLALFKRLVWCARAIDQRYVLSTCRTEYLKLYPAVFTTRYVYSIILGHVYLIKYRPAVLTRVFFTLRHFRLFARQKKIERRICIMISA